MALLALAENPGRQVQGACRARMAAEDRWTEFAERGLATSGTPARCRHRAFGRFVRWDRRLPGRVFNGVVDGGIADLDTGDSKDAAGRIFVQPFKATDISLLKGFGAGFAGTYGNEQASSTTTNLASYKTVGQNTFFSFRSGAAPERARGARVTSVVLLLGTRWDPGRIRPLGAATSGRYGSSLREEQRLAGGRNTLCSPAKTLPTTASPRGVRLI